MVKLQKVIFKNHRNCLLRTSTNIQNIQQRFIKLLKAGYAVLMAIVRAELRAREASSFCDFLKGKGPLTISPHFTLFFTQANVCFCCRSMFFF